VLPAVACETASPQRRLKTDAKRDRERTVSLRRSVTNDDRSARWPVLEQLPFCHRSAREITGLDRWKSVPGGTRTGCHTTYARLFVDRAVMPEHSLAIGRPALTIRISRRRLIATTASGPATMGSIAMPLEPRRRRRKLPTALQWRRDPRRRRWSGAATTGPRGAGRGLHPESFTTSRRAVQAWRPRAGRHRQKALSRRELQAGQGIFYGVDIPDLVEPTVTGKSMVGRVAPHPPTSVRSPSPGPAIRWFRAFGLTTPGRHEVHDQWPKSRPDSSSTLADNIYAAGPITRKSTATCALWKNIVTEEKSKPAANRGRKYRRRLQIHLMDKKSGRC